MKWRFARFVKRRAENLKSGTFDGSKFSCKTHGEFDVVNMALSIPDYREATTEVWEAALRKAKSRTKQGNAPAYHPMILRRPLNRGPRSSKAHGHYFSAAVRKERHEFFKFII